MSKKMTAEKFVKAYSGAPIDIGEAMELASEVDGSLGEKAQRALEARQEFEAELEKVGFEFG